MRWKEKEKIMYKAGDVLKRKEFLFFPLKINKETRWLETAIWSEQVNVWFDVDGQPYLKWVPFRWEEDNEI